MENAILEYFKAKRKERQRQQAELERERLQRSDKVKSLSEEIARRPITDGV